MIISHQARKQIGLIASLLAEFADVSSERMRIELPLMENKLADGLVIFLNVPK